MLRHAHPMLAGRFKHYFVLHISALLPVAIFNTYLELVRRMGIVQYTHANCTVAIENAHLCRTQGVSEK